MYMPWLEILWLVIGLYHGHRRNQDWLYIRVNMRVEGGGGGGGFVIHPSYILALK